VEDTLDSDEEVVYTMADGMDSAHVAICKCGPS